ncbi:maintenance of telomere capping protein 1 [Podospora fimiseda]|uniref:Maintenance of telomere capping protein 1 n=1 Tax=Podospora fimiseda TaxID=252190 RepID=A0AAN7H7X0_9PEZI|nr:maintenance of telomere capping protein 1 [Podospora fimiseda]
MTTDRSQTADDEIDALFEDLDQETATKKPTKPSKPVPASSSSKTAKPTDASAEFDPLADLENQLEEEKAPRPHTPRIREIASKASPAKRAAANTPPPAIDSSSTRKSAESTTSYHATPSATSSSELHDASEKTQTSSGGGGGWWGGILSTATAAMKQAETVVKVVQQNEEARKWADQVRGNVGALRGLGDELRHRALPSLTTILHTLAPPISSHERLLIHITHDLVGYPLLDPLIYAVFNRVMAQVEGGDLMVVQRGQESSSASNQSTAGWRDGPWWRATDPNNPRNLGIVAGLVEGTKLCRANADGYASEYFAARGGIEAARQRALEPVSESNPVRSSDIFLSVQAISLSGGKALFAPSSAAQKKREDDDESSEDEDENEQVCFAVYILDPVHDIQYSAVSQAVPAKWIRWLDAVPGQEENEEDEEFEAQFGKVPDEIRDIIETGGVDPREWVSEWVEEALSLSVGVVAQRYVARRMGVGEGGGMKGKQKVEDVMADGGGEAARAGLI